MVKRKDRNTLSNEGVDDSKSADTHYKLLHKPEVKMKVCEYLASGFSSRMIADMLEEEDGIIITRTAVNAYRHKPEWKKIIDKVREKMAETVADHVLADKKARLNWLLKAAEEAMAWRHDKTTFSRFGDRVDTYKRNIGEIKGLIREARAEIEGEENREVGLKLIIQRADGHDKDDKE